MSRGGFTSPIAAIVLASFAISFESYADGLPLAPDDSTQSHPVITTDGQGGAYVVLEGDALSWTYAQRLNADATRATGWPVSGDRLPVRLPHIWRYSYQRADPVIVSDGAVGAFVADDGYEYFSAVTVSHLDAQGISTVGWPSGGVLVSGLGSQASAGSVPAPDRSLSPQSPLTGDYFPRLALDGSGGVLVAWNYITIVVDNIRIDRISATGERAAGWPVDGVKVADYGWGPVVCGDGAGGGFVLWPGSSVFAQHVLGDGTIDTRWPVAGLVVCGQPGPQDAVGVVADGAGGFIAAWEDERVPGDRRLYAQHVLADGTTAPGWPADGLLLSSGRTSPGSRKPYSRGCCLEYTSTLSDGAGGAFLCWTSDDSGDGGDVVALRIHGDGTIADGWTAGGTPLSRAPGRQEFPTLAPDGAGGIFVAWQDRRGADLDVYAQRLDASGARASGWLENGFPVCVASGDQETPVIAAGEHGRALVAWTDHRGAYANVYAGVAGPDDRVPVLASLVSADAAVDRARIVWRVVVPASPFHVFRAASDGAWRVVAGVSSDFDGRVAYEDRDVVAGAVYHYRLGTSLDPEEAGGDARVEIPRVTAFAFDPIVPNPATGRMRLAFATPAAGPVSLEAFDLSGRRVLRRELGGTAGRQVASIDAGFPGAGVYLVRLSYGDRVLSRRVVVLEGSLTR